jgi:hypothetical protein
MRAAQIRHQVEPEGRAAFSVQVTVRVEAMKAVQSLKPYEGETITKAVDYYVHHVLRFRNAPTVKTVLAEILAHKQASGRRERTIRQFRFMCERFAVNFGDRGLSTIRPDAIRA